MSTVYHPLEYSSGQHSGHSSFPPLTFRRGSMVSSPHAAHAWEVKTLACSGMGQFFTRCTVKRRSVGVFSILSAASSLEGDFDLPVFFLRGLLFRETRIPFPALSLVRLRNTKTIFPQSWNMRLPLPSVHPVKNWIASTAHPSLMAMQISSSSAARLHLIFSIPIRDARYPMVMPGHRCP